MASFQQTQPHGEREPTIVWKLCHLRNLIFRRKLSKNYCIIDIANLKLSLLYVPVVN